MPRLRAAPLTALLCLPALAAPRIARADIGAFPQEEVARPVLAPAGLTETRLDATWVFAPTTWNADARTAPASDGAVTSAVLLSVTGRYGLFRALEINVRAPWTLDLHTKGGTGQDGGSGRLRLGLGWNPPWTAPGTDVALESGLVLPTTSHALRTDEAGVVHRDHLAVDGVIRAKYRLTDDSAAHAEGGLVFPFANADDRAADRSPPLTFFVSAGSTFQLDPRLWVDAAAGFTRTNRDRIAGGIVPRSDQFLVDVRPSVGVSPTRWYDLVLTGSLPLAGKNTPVAYQAGLELRARF